MARTVTYRRRTKTGKMTTVRRRVKGNGPKPKPKSASKSDGYAGKEVKVFTSTSRWVGKDGLNYQSRTRTEVLLKDSYKWEPLPKGYKVRSKKEKFGPFNLRTRTVRRLVKK